MAPLFGLLWLWLAGAAMASDSPIRWRRVEGPAGSRSARALAIDPSGDRVAVADARGVWLRGRGLASRRIARLADPNDLIFDARGALWIATDAGLWRLPPGADGARLEDRSPAPGEAARQVHRVAAAAGFLAVGTGAGAFASADGVSWRRVDGSVSRRSVRAVALRPTGSGAELWLAAGTELWRVALARGSGPGELRVSELRRVPVPGRPADREVVDLALDLPGVAVALLYPRSLALRWASGGPGGSGAASEWVVRRPGLPPGASAGRIGYAQAVYWLATDRGLLRSPALNGTWRRSAPPAGRAEIRAVAASRDTLWAATASGLLEGRPETAAPMSAAVARSGGRAEPGERLSADVRSPRDPEIRSVQRAALRYLGLDAARLRAQRRGLRRRGWLPSLSLRFGIDRDRDWSRDDDQAFVSGAVRFLHDREVEHGRQLDGSVNLSWDLDRLAYDPEWVDLSREIRQWIALRDDVLDEVNQLYFERQGVLRTLAGPTGLEPSDTARLQLRAKSLRAGLDAWTGGWFSGPRRSPEMQGE